MAISTKDLMYPRDEMDNYRRRVDEEYNFYRQKQMAEELKRREFEMLKTAGMAQVMGTVGGGGGAGASVRWDVGHSLGSVRTEPYPPEPMHVNKKLLLCEV